MKSLRETCIDFFTDENIKKDVREMIKPIFHLIYNEVYIYIWLIAFYHFFIMCMILAMFCILWKLLKTHEWKHRLFSKFSFLDP